MSFLDYVPLIGDALGSVGNIASSLVSDSAMRYASDRQYQSNHETNAMNLRIAETNNEAAKQLWREQSAYNSPKNQMARYLEAGLNPNLMASSGQVNSGNASTAPQLHQAVMRPYNGYIQTAIARANNLQRAVSSVTGMLNSIGSWQKLMQDIRTSKAQEEAFISQAEKNDADAQRINLIRPFMVQDWYMRNQWTGWRNNAFVEWTKANPANSFNPFWNNFRLGMYNADVAFERANNLNLQNMILNQYGLETALEKLNFIKSQTKRNKVAADVMRFLAPAQLRNLISSSNLNDERTFGQTLQNGLSAMEFDDNSKGGNIGFTNNGFKFTLKDIKRLWNNWFNK